MSLSHFDIGMDLPVPGALTAIVSSLGIIPSNLDKSASCLTMPVLSVLLGMGSVISFVPRFR